MKDYKYSSELSKKFKQRDVPAKFHSMVELHVPDFEITKNFYSKLGFEVVWERYPEGFKGYLVMKLEENIICFWGGSEVINEHPYFKNFPKDSRPGYRVELVLLVKYVEKLYKLALENDCVFEHLQTWPWGMTDFRIKDPFRFYLRISEMHNVLSDENPVK